MTYNEVQCADCGNKLSVEAIQLEIRPPMPELWLFIQAFLP